MVILLLQGEELKLPRSITLRLVDIQTAIQTQIYQNEKPVFFLAVPPFYKESTEI